ncbi:MAG TPA: isoprenylcysteine carboxylmethyltransferase family protein [Kiritimatiellia bacterium]|jgi:protein-S-isoprenylcysteine O-methyltransferase Ste14
MDSEVIKPALSPRVLAARMVVYATAFLAFILVLVPAGFHWLGNALGLQPWGMKIFGPLGAARPFIGIAIFVVGVTSYFICSLWLVIVGKGPFVEFDPPREFVATGPYRWTRNPVAASLIVCGLAEAIYFASAGILLFVLIGLPLAHLQVTRIEEPLLRKRFGDSYEAYCRRTNRWLPRKPAA